MLISFRAVRRAILLLTLCCVGLQRFGDAQSGGFCDKYCGLQDHIWNLYQRLRR